MSDKTTSPVEKKQVLILGGGIAGLTAALELSRAGIRVDIVEKSGLLGGHAIQFACKAVDGVCVKCGACMIEERLAAMAGNRQIRVHLNTSVTTIKRSERFSLHLRRKTDNPEDSVRQDALPAEEALEADAVVVATGFEPFNPERKPYGFGRFPNVISTLDLERQLRQEGAVRRPSDGKIPGRLAFIQCVGSRDATLNHLWCSKVCCASALRMARKIRSLEKEMEVSFYYIDIQTLGKDFQRNHQAHCSQVRTVRAIPADIVSTQEDRLKVTCLDPRSHETLEEAFDLVVLSIGMTPGPDAPNLAGLLDLQLSEDGFLEESESTDGVFVAGSARGPMDIAGAAASAGETAARVLEYIQKG